MDVIAAEAEIRRTMDGNSKKSPSSFKPSFCTIPQGGRIFKIHTYPGDVISSEGIVEIRQVNQMYAVAGEGYIKVTYKKLKSDKKCCS